MIEITQQLGDILLQDGTISADQLEAALEYQVRKGCRLGEALTLLHFCTETDIARAVAEQNGIRFVDLEQTPPEGEAIRLIPREVAVEHGIVPVKLEGNRLLVVARDPFDLDIDDVIRQASRMRAIIAVGTDPQIRNVLSRYDEFKWSDGTARGLDRRGTGVRAPMPTPEPRRAAPSPDRPQVLSNHPLDLLLIEAVQKRASDLYMEPVRDGFRVRLRVDGFIHSLPVMPRYRMDGILKRLKIMTGLDFHETALSTTGTFRIRVDERTVDVRATILSEAEGVFASFRLQSPDEPVRSLDSLGMDAESLRELRRRLAAREGLILVAGPAGSGRPSTLHSLLKAMQESGEQVLALESTFERRLTDVGQVVMKDGAAESFSTALTVCLGQRPGALMVGELPDKDSAEIACRAASTGQMVLAGSLSSNALRAVTRLLDMGTPAPAVAASLSAVVAQRLVRRICETCVREHQMAYPLERALRETYGWPNRARFKIGGGCAECYELGTRGCVGVFEVLLVDDDLRRLVADRVPPSVLEAHLTARGFRSLEEDAFTKACRGLIPPEELPRLGLRVGEALEAARVRMSEDEDEELPDSAFRHSAPAPAAGTGAPVEAWDDLVNRAAFLTPDRENGRHSSLMGRQPGP